MGTNKTPFYHRIYLSVKLRQNVCVPIVTANMTLFQNEVFGPILAVSTFEPEVEAIALANNNSYGLAASFYRQNVQLTMRVARAIKTGTVSCEWF